MDIFICQYCGSKRKNSNAKGQHETRCDLNPNKKIPWNKGLTKKTSSILSDFSDNCKMNCVGRKHSDETKQKISLSLKGKSNGIALTPEKETERRRKLSEIAKKRNFGGYVKGSGNGKKGWYKGFFCDSSWELAYVIYCLDHSLSIERNKEKRTYTYKGKTKKYIPDFIVSSRLVEIKGFKTDEWEAKLKFNPDITVLYEEDLSSVFEYVKSTYGKDFIRLYE